MDADSKLYMGGNMTSFRPREMGMALTAIWKRSLPFPPKVCIDILRRSA